MHRHGALLVAVACCFRLMAAGGAREAAAQMYALPPSTAVHADRPVASPGPLGFLPETAPADAWGHVIEGPPVDLAVAPGGATYFQRRWTWQVLPSGLLYPAYLAAGRESRFATHWFHQRDRGWLWDVALGGHVGILRYGTSDALPPEGYQIDVEGAAFPRLTLDEARNLVSADFRFGIPLTHRLGPWESKFAYYHLSSHLGDEYMVEHATWDRRNYVRDVLVLGLAWRPNPNWRLYGEAGWAFHINGGSEPWEFQFGVDFSPAQPWSALGTPFLAVNTRLREEVDFGGNFTVQTGLQWPGRAGQLFRVGLHYFNGKSDQYQFFREHEEQIGLGIWYDY